LEVGGGDLVAGGDDDDLLEGSLFVNLVGDFVEGEAPAGGEFLGDGGVR
jgi:hypothetical protein